MSTVIFTGSVRMFGSQHASVTNSDSGDLVWSERVDGSIVVRSKRKPGKQARVPAHVVRVIDEADETRVPVAAEAPKAKSKAKA